MREIAHNRRELPPLPVDDKVVCLRLTPGEIISSFSFGCLLLVWTGNRKHETVQMAMEEDLDLQPLTPEEMLNLARGTSVSHRSLSCTARSALTSGLPRSFNRCSRGSSAASSNSSSSYRIARSLGESCIGHVQARTWAGQV